MVAHPPFAFLPHGRLPTSPVAWAIGIAIVGAVLLTIAGYEARRARLLQRRHPGSKIWALHLPRTTRYLLVSDDEVALLRGSGSGSRWPIAEVRRTAAAPVKFPRALVKQPGLILEVGGPGQHQRYEVIFPRLAGLAGSAAAARAAHEAITAAKGRATDPR